MAGGKRLKPALTDTLKDPAAEKIRRNQDERIDELQGIPLVRGKLIKAVELPDATNVPVHHALGRVATVIPGAPYALGGSVTSGSIRDRSRVLSDQYDPRQYAVLFAEGWGVTMYVDVWVF